MKFFFKAKDQEGKIQEGVVNAMNEEMAAQILQRKNLIPVSVQIEQEARTMGDLLKNIQKSWSGVSPKEMVIFFRQLATLIQAHVPILNALHAISDQTENPYFRSVLLDVADNVEDGMTLSESFAGHPDVFSPFVVSLIRAGEVSGNLHRSVNTIADNVEKNYQLTSRIRGALLYPAFILTVGLIVAFLITAFVLPKLTQLIKEMDVAVPWYTQAVMAFGSFMGEYWWAVAIMFMAGVGAMAYYLNTEGGRREWHRVVLTLPVFGNLARYVYLSRFAENLSSILSSGIPMVRSLTIVADVVGNDVYRDVILSATEEVQGGGNISTAFSRYPEHIPVIVSQMIKVGEETGEMDHVLKSIADFYSQETENITRNLITLIEPIMIVVLAIFVAILVFSVILPIYNLVGQISNSA